MFQRYQYSKFEIIFPWAMFVLLPILGIAYAPTLTTEPVAIFYWLFMLALAGIPIMWISNNLVVRIEVNDLGLSYQSMYGKRTILWNNIKEVHRRAIVDLTAPINEPELFISSVDGKRISLYPNLQRCDGTGGGIDELESIIRARVGSKCTDPELQEAKELRRLKRLTVLAGMLCFTFATIWIWRPMISLTDEKFGFISSAIGISADALVLIVSGLFLTVLGLYQLRKK